MLRANEIPYQYIHLSYPKTLESIVVRQAERVTTKLISSVQNEEPDKSFDKAKSAIISDLSAAGAYLKSSDTLGDVGDTLTINALMAVGDIEQYLSISAIIRRVNILSTATGKKQNHFDCGVEFQLLEENEKLLIHGYVYEQLIKGFSD